MRIVTPLVLATLCLAPSFVRAEGDEGLTARVPKQSPICLRVASLKRIDALAQEIVPLIKAIDPSAVGPLAEAAPSDLLIGMMGLKPEQLDANAPMILGLAYGQPLILMPAPEGATLPEPVTLPTGMQLSLDGGVYRMVPAGIDLSAVQTREGPTSMLAGDVSVHVYLDELVERNRQQIEGMLGLGAMQAQQQAGGIELMAKLAQPFMKVAMKAVDGVKSFDYALTWEDGLILSEGQLATRKDSAFAAFLNRMGAPGGNGLAGYLPRNTFMVVDIVGNPDFPMKEMSSWLTESLGEGAGEAIAQLMSMATPLVESMSGKQVMGVQLQGMMGFTMSQIAELKEGVDPATLFDSYDTDKVNAALETLGLPLTYKFIKAVDKHGDTPLHQLIMQSSDPNMTMMTAMMQVFMAAENGHLFIVTGPTAMTDLRDLLDRVRAGQPIEHPHLAAMQRLGRERNLGLSINVGGFKAMAGMFAMMDPDFAKVVNEIPDELYFSTSMAVHDGTMHWRGDWPASKLAKIAAAIRSVENGGAGGEEQPEEPEPEHEPDFD